MSEEAARLAEKCAELVSERGLAKREYEDDMGALCLWGALLVARDGQIRVPSPKLCGPAYEVARMVDRHVPGPGSAVTWNDSPEVGAEDVVLMFKQVAEELRER